MNGSPNIDNPDWRNDKNVVVRFFFWFARFEYALKKGDFFKSSEKPLRNAEADWDKFANRLGDSFFNEMKGADECRILFKEPPKKQVINNGRLGWKPLSKSEDCQQLFHAVRRVRNNLFHGGKTMAGPYGYPDDRDKNLIEASLFVLEKALEKCNGSDLSGLKKVHDAFVSA